VVAGGQVVAVVVKVGLFDGGWGRGGGRSGRLPAAGGGGGVGGFGGAWDPRLEAGRATAAAALFRRGVGDGQVRREGAALARRALDVEGAAEHPGDFAADRKAQAGAAILAGRAGFGLLEGLEDDLLLVLRDPDAGVAHVEGDDLLGAVELGMGADLSAGGDAHRQLDLALLGELEGVREEVLEDLLEALGVGAHRAREFRREREFEAELLLLG
jgi:hypothetical protein